MQVTLVDIAVWIAGLHAAVYIAPNLSRGVRVVLAVAWLGFMFFIVALGK